MNGEWHFGQSRRIVPPKSDRGTCRAIVCNGMSSLGLLPATALAPVQILSITVFALACATMFYALFGYPMLLGWMARRSHNPVHKDDRRMLSYMTTPVKRQRDPATLGLTECRERCTHLTLSESVG